MVSSRLGRGARFASLLLVMVLLVAACGSDGNSDDGATGTTGAPGEPHGVLRLAGADPTSLDPAVNGGAPENYLAPIFDTLIDSKTQDGNIQPKLAETWEVDIPNATLTFHLRSDVTFTDGTVLDSSVVLANFKYKQENDSRLATIYKSLEAPDPTTFVITLNTFNKIFLDTLGAQAGMIMSPASFEADPDNEPVGSGPYVLDSWSAQKVTYVPNPDHWSEGAAKVERLEIYNGMSDPGAQLNALLSDQIDIVTLDPATATQLPDGEYELVTKPQSAYAVVVLDREGTTVPALGDPQVRRAMARAIDRDAIVDAVLQEFGQSSTQPTPENVRGYDEKWEDELSFDPEAAREMLADAGYEDGFEFDAPVNATTSTFATALQQMFEDVGITMNIRLLDTAAYNEAVRSTEYPVTISTSMTVDEPYASISLYQGNGPFNTFGLDEPELNDLVTQAGLTTDPDELLVIDQAVAEIVVGDAFVITAATGDSIAAHNDKVATVEWVLKSPGLDILDITMK